MYTQITSSESMHMKKWTDQTPKEEELKTNAVLGTEFSSSMTHLHGEISSSISWRSARHEAQCQALRPVRRGFYSTEEVPSTRGSLLPLFPAEAQPQERGGRCSRGAEASPSATTSGEACGRPYGICSARNRRLGSAENRAGGVPKRRPPAWPWPNRPTRGGPRPERGFLSAAPGEHGQDWHGDGAASAL
jgi:hypothetical protein